MNSEQISEYSPQHPDLSVLDNSIQVILTHRGIHYIARVPLGDAFDLADGPMSLESGCMSAVREICQAIYELKP